MVLREVLRISVAVPVDEGLDNVTPFFLHSSASAPKRKELPSNADMQCITESIDSMTA